MKEDIYIYNMFIQFLRNAILIEHLLFLFSCQLITPVQ